MKMNIKTKTLAGNVSLLSAAGKYLLLLGIALMITAGSFAQETDGDPGGGPGDPDVPFDGGISLLVAAGVAYGAKKAHEAKKKQAAYPDQNKE
jgi:hypothetical protein